MTDQPKLKLETAEPWEHVAREFGDHDMETEGGWNPVTTMERVGDAYYIGDWLPVEPVCKEVVRLRDMVMGSSTLRAEIAALRAKLDAIHRYVADRADSVDRPDGGSYPNAEARIWQEFFGSKEPQPKEESDAQP